MTKTTRLMVLLAIAAFILVLGVVAQQKADDKAVDPVCGMTVTKAKAAATFDYKGTTYYFCSKGCKEAFSKEPEKYLAKKAAKEEPQDVLVPAPHGMGGRMHTMPMEGGVNRLLLRRDVDWTFEKTATGVTVKISSKDPETVKAIQERLATAKEMRETMAAPPAAAAASAACSCPNCQMKEKAKK